MIFKDTLNLAITYSKVNDRFLVIQASRYNRWENVWSFSGFYAAMLEYLEKTNFIIHGSRTFFVWSYVKITQTIQNNGSQRYPISSTGIKMIVHMHTRFSCKKRAYLYMSWASLSNNPPSLIICSSRLFRWTTVDL